MVSATTVVPTYNFALNQGGGATNFFSMKRVHTSVYMSANFVYACGDNSLEVLFVAVLLNTATTL